MNITVEEVAPCRKKVAVEIPSEEVDRAFDEIYNEARAVAQVPGFRRGKVPRHVLERKFGPALADDVRGRLFQRGLTQALKDHKLSPLGEPALDIDKLAAERGKSFAFAAELDVRPAFELGEYKGLKLVEEIEPVTDADIDERIERLRYNFAEKIAVDDPAAEGNLLEGDVTLRCGEEEIFRQSERALKIEGSTLFGIEVGPLAPVLAGARAGENRTITFSLPGDYPREELRGREAVFEIAITKVLRVDLPALDEAFLSRIGMESAEKLREQFRASFESDRKAEARRELEESLVTALVERHSFDLPAGVLERQSQLILAQQQVQMMRLGLPAEALKEREEEFRRESRADAERRLRRMVLFDTIAEKESIAVSGEELRQHIHMLARAYRTTPEKMVKEIEQRDGLAAVESEIRDMKVVRFLLDHAEIETRERTGDGRADKETVA